jgi:hypothetical protein
MEFSIMNDEVWWKIKQFKKKLQLGRGTLCSAKIVMKKNPTDNKTFTMHVLL